MKNFKDWKGSVSADTNLRMMRWMGAKSPNFRGITDYDVLLKLALGYAWNRALGTPRDRKVTFCITGVEKSGTTVLSAYLSRHPEIRMPLRKEPRYFVDNRFFPEDGGLEGNAEWLR